MLWFWIGVAVILGVVAVAFLQRLGETEREQDDDLKRYAPLSEDWQADNLRREGTAGYLNGPNWDLAAGKAEQDKQLDREYTRRRLELIRRKRDRA